ncbi:mucosa-associated lymphoid tissue lymphoma translocation protein 1-like [Apostichopus japonicus]|uniref:mucosa-associated lymphoid tissue lymphoma translocation protein 1-like n=1 Tax=Stichopus japonicus TaxID=307972 RepID=UPI003AB4A551
MFLEPFTSLPVAESYTFTMEQFVDPESGISDLSYRLLMQISNNIGKDWRQLFQVLPDNYYNAQDVEYFANAIYMDEKPAMRLLHDLATKGQTVRHLISYLEHLRLENALKLLKAPEQLYLVKEPSDGTFQEGSAITIQCSAVGFPYPRYQWFHIFKTRDDSSVTKKLSDGVDKVLKIAKLKQEDSGGYFCQIYHILPDRSRPQMHTKVAYISVTPSYNSSEAQAPVIKREPKSVTTLKGKPVYLDCRAEGKPEPQYQWYKRGHNNELHKKGKEVKWEQADFDDSGSYICKVWNRNGTTWSKEVTVTVLTGGQPQEDAVIKIERQPVDSICLVGAKHTLECQATSKLTLLYQWYKDEKPLEGKTSSKLPFDAVKAEDQGKYYCKICNKAGGSQISNSVNLEIKPTEPFVGYFANDKVALLIGNKAYRGIDALTAVNHDVDMLQKCLQLNLKFKCLSLMNLNRSDIQKAVSIFCDLITENSYAVFYFSGHGFQHLHRTYMVPVDAHFGYTSEESICVQDVQRQIQEKKPALNAMFLDICRSPNENERGPPNTNMESCGRGNSIIFCASNIGSEAFELRGEGGYRPRGIFSDYLVKRLCQKEPLTRIIDQVRLDVGNDSKACRLQFPALQTDLRFPLSLHDPVTKPASFEVNQLYEKFWKPLMVTGKVALSIADVKMTLDYTWAFSNIMRVDIKTIDRTDVDPQLKVDPNSLSIVDLTDRERQSDKCWKVWHIGNIQRAQLSLVVSVIIDSKRHQTKVLFPEIHISKIWNSARRTPVCVEREFPDATSSDFSSGSSGLCGTLDTLSLNRDDQYGCRSGMAS